MSSPKKEPSRAQPDSAQLLDFLLEHIPDVIFFKDLNGRFIRVNNAFAKLFGLGDASDVVGKSDFDFLLPEDAERTLADEREVLSTGRGILDTISKKSHHDGSPWWALTSKLPLYNADGEIIGTCGISRDITALKQAETDLSEANRELESSLGTLQEIQAQLIEAEKAQSIARLAEGVSHEVRNPLAVLSMGFEFLSGRASIKTDPDCQLVLKDMREALDRADRVIVTLLEASRPAGLDLKPVEVEGLLWEAIARLESSIEVYGVSVKWDLSHQAKCVMADSEKLTNVLEGLLSNAVEAMATGGELTLRTRVEAWQPDVSKRDAGLRGGQLFHGTEEVICIDIIDTGCGIPADAMPRVFDAFFTTKETGPHLGLGLGLTTCRAIIELHGGLVELANRKDAKGAIVTIKLRPCAA